MSFTGYIKEQANEIRKSQIAIQYAHDVRRNSPNTYILWVHASSSARFQEAYQDIAQRLKLPGRDDPQQNLLQLVYRWLADDENGPWLMIVDSADDGDVLFASQAAVLSESERRLTSYIPKTGRGSVLVTSRSVKVAAWLVGDDNIFQVPVMESDQAMQLLRVRLGKAIYDNDAANSLLYALDYLPLAIIQAASYIKRQSVRKTTITSYLEEFQRSVEKKTGLLAREANDLRRDDSASNAVVTTWQLTFNQVRRDRPSATELLCFMSFLNPQGIPESVLISYSKQGKDKEIEEDLEVLLGYSLITAAVDGYTLEMHALVQFCTQVWLATFDDKERWRCKFLNIISSQYPFGVVENWTICRKLDPHIETAIEACPKAEADIMSWCALLHNAAGYRDSNGRHGEAEEMNRRTLEARRNILGEVHPDTLGSMNNLASVLQAQGKHGEAEEINRRTLEARKTILGEEHPDTLASINNLAWVLQAQGKHSEAEKLNRRTLEAKRNILGKEHPDTLASMNNLAWVLQAQGKHGEAEEMNRRTLEARRNILGEEHPDTLASMNNLAWVLQAQGKHGEAEEMNRRTLEARRNILGEEHPDTLTSMNNLAWVLQVQGKYGEAEEINQRTLEAKRNILGEEHPDTLGSINNLAWVLQAQGKHGEAEEMNRRTLEARRNILGEEHPDTLTSMNNLAWVLQVQGKHGEAEEMSRRTLEARRNILGQEHPDTLVSTNTLAHIYWSQRRESEALQVLHGCIRLQERTLGLDHPHTQASISSLQRWESAQ